MVKKNRQIFAMLMVSVVLGLGVPVMASERADNGTVLNVVADQRAQSDAITHDKLILNSPVVDEAKILSTHEKSHLETQLRQIYDDKLAQIAIVIIPSTGGMDIFDYAYQVAKRWELGDKEHDNGVLVLVAVDDRQIQILTGYGVEGVLPDAVVNRIIREDITPSFKTQGYAQGLSAGIGRMDERLRADPDVLAKADEAYTKAQKAEQQNEAIPMLFFAFFFLMNFGQNLTAILGRVLGASVATAIFVALGLWAGSGFGFGVATGLVLLVLGVVLWSMLAFNPPSSKGIHRGRGGNIKIGGGSGGFGGGGFGGGGFRGGGFGGGGARGSW
ncbi:MAG: TPM domain-containing protein [Moraxella sp.]|uniref:TPM domain-containing protein n=1 Tax=Moraxella sp. TaxID=479 RepID=UPI0026DBAC15|nr:TPM domain-containing protein [Moraxella sp.]MDO4450942.1 TPM domain-containing protein [Moraxella sp.]